MKNLLRTSLAVLAGLSGLVQATDAPQNNVQRRNGGGLSDLLGELEALGVLNGAGEGNRGNGGKGEKGGGHKVSTVTATKATAAAAGRKNDTCQAGKEHTKTFTQQAAGVAGGTGNVHLSLTTKTQFGTGVTPTITVTQSPQTITQEITVTVSGNAPGTPTGQVANHGGTTTLGAGGGVGAPAQSVPAGVNPPVGASGTGGASTAVVVKTSSPAVAGTASPAAAQPALSVGSPGAVVNGQGATQADGSCDCQCLCGAGSFNMGAMPPGPAGAGVGTTLTTVSINTATLSPAGTTSVSVAGAAGSPAPGVSSSSISTSTSATIPKTTLSSAGPAPPAAPQGASTTSSITSSVTKPTALSEASSLVLSISSPLAAAQPALAQPTDPIDISSFTLQSSLMLGNLATATIKV